MGTRVTKVEFIVTSYVIYYLVECRQEQGRKARVAAETEVSEWVLGLAYCSSTSAAWPSGRPAVTVVASRVGVARNSGHHVAWTVGVHAPGRDIRTP